MQLLTARERDEDRARGRSARQVDIGGERASIQPEAVPGRVVNELRRRQAGGIERADLALRPAAHGAPSDVVDIHIARGSGRLVGEGELLAGVIETEVVDPAVLQTG